MYVVFKLSELKPRALNESDMQSGEGVGNPT